jgi:ubiquinone/menaquinone biosynthesis C-methylase UbiE
LNSKSPSSNLRFPGLLPDFAARSTRPELIDGTDYTPAEFDDSLADLRRVNKYLGGKRALARHLFPLIEAVAARERAVSLLDVGTGSADIPAFVVEWARGRGIKLQFAVLDYNHLAARKARDETAAYSEIVTVQADATRLPFADRSFHFVTASLFLHHFETPQAARLLSNFARVASVAFIVNDLRRHPAAYYSIMLLTRLFTRNRLVRHDAALSVLRGFAKEDIEELKPSTPGGVKAFRHFPYRYILIGETK